MARQAPQAKEIEEAVLGAVMLERNALDIVQEIVAQGAFYVNAHNQIYDVIRSLAAQNKPVEMLSVFQEIKNLGLLDEIGGLTAITRLTSRVVSSANIEHHCKIVQEKFIRREMIRIAGEAITAAYDESNDTFLILEESEKSFLEIGTRNIPSNTLGMADVMKQMVEKIEYWRTLDGSLTGVPSGFREIDRATRGFQDGDLIIIAARPSVGKTAFALNLARNAAKNKFPVAMFSLEMKAIMQGLRLLSAESATWLVKIQTGRLSDEEMALLHKGAISSLANLPIFFDDNSNLSIGRFRAAVRRMVKKKGIKMVVVDYLQLMSADGKVGSREQEVSMISREIKKLAMELELPIVALSQLSREVEKRTNKTPILADLRESGSIEQDADVVGFLYGSTEEDVKNDPDLAGKRFFKIAKQRNGTLLTAELDFRNEIQLFTDPGPKEGTTTWKKIESQAPLPF